MKYEVEKVIIRCPECQHIQVAEVNKEVPETYIHLCEKCDHVIMEAEWEEVYEEEMDEIVLRIQQNEIDSLKLQLRIQQLKREIFSDITIACLLVAFITYVTWILNH